MNSTHSHTVRSALIKAVVYHFVMTEMSQTFDFILPLCKFNMTISGGN